MPSIYTHLHLALLFADKIELKNPTSFMLGNAYPDVWETSKEKALTYHYMNQENKQCDLSAFLKNEPMNDFNLGYFFHLWVDNYIQTINLMDINKYDCMICDIEVIASYIETIKKMSFQEKEKQSFLNILLLEKKPMPLYLVSSLKKENYKQILNSIVNTFIKEHITLITHI